MPAWSCISCGAEVSADERFCPACGTALWTSCPACGAEQPVSAAFCSACGTPLQPGVGADELRKLGRRYDAACVDLEAAADAELAGDTAAAAEARARASAVLDPLGCVNPF